MSGYNFTDGVRKCLQGAREEAIRLLQEALSIDPADTQAGALLESTQIRMRDEERARETRVRKALANAEARLAAEDVAGARAELQRALEAGGEIPVADDLTSRIGRAEQDAAARDKRAAERRARAAALLESARESMSASSYAEAVRVANEALVADPTCAEAAEIRRQALAAVEEERAALDRREAGEREKAAGFKLLGEGKYRESRAAFVRAAEWLGITRRTLYRMAERFGIDLPHVSDQVCAQGPERVVADGNGDDLDPG